ncbi:UvrB/UvrC motif-containing protein [Prevotella nigrescens]
MNKIQVFFKGITEIVGGSNMGLLVLTNQLEDKQVAIVCDGIMVHELNLRIGENSFRYSLLPEVLCWINPDMDSEHYEILFNSISDGQYKVVLINKFTYEMIPIRASDAILLSKIVQIDLYMEEKLFIRQSVPYELNKNKVALPLNALTSSMLHDALQKAIKDENYELASNLRDEIQKRKDNQDKVM